MFVYTWCYDQKELQLHQSHTQLQVLLHTAKNSALFLHVCHSWNQWCLPCPPQVKGDHPEPPPWPWGARKRTCPMQDLTTLWNLFTWAHHLGSWSTYSLRQSVAAILLHLMEYFREWMYITPMCDSKVVWRKQANYSCRNLSTTPKVIHLFF